MDKGFAHNSSLVSASILVVDSANSIRSSFSITAIVGVRTRNKKETNKTKMKHINMNQIGIRAVMFESYLRSKADVFYTSNNSEVAV